MRPRSITVTSSNSPYYFPINWRGGVVGIVATPDSGNYDVAYTNEPDVTRQAGGAGSVTDWVDISGMSAATAQATAEVNVCTCLRITLNSGTSVKVDIAQATV